MTKCPRFCSSCGNEINPGDRFCGDCGQPIYVESTQSTNSGQFIPPPPYEAPQNQNTFAERQSFENTSGRGKSSIVPEEVKKWSWGAFFLNWIWGIGNNTYIALLCMIPFVNLFMIVVLGVKGSVWAWQNRQWESIEHFKRVQEKWAWWGFGSWIFGITIILIEKYFWTSLY